LEGLEECERKMEMFATQSKDKNTTDKGVILAIFWIMPPEVTKMQM
jgi:hypothetical protein